MTTDSASDVPPTVAGEEDSVSLAWDEFLSRFEHTWRVGVPADFDAFVAVVPLSRRAVLLPELVFVDLEYRLKGGEAVRVEDYLKRHPDLEGNRDRVLELAAWEFELRRRTGRVAIDEYLARFPWAGPEFR